MLLDLNRRIKKEVAISCGVENAEKGNKIPQEGHRLLSALLRVATIFRIAGIGCVTMSGRRPSSSVRDRSFLGIFRHGYETR